MVFGSKSSSSKKLAEAEQLQRNLEVELDRARTQIQEAKQAQSVLQEEERDLQSQILESQTNQEALQEAIQKIHAERAKIREGHLQISSAIFAEKFAKDSQALSDARVAQHAMLAKVVKALQDCQEAQNQQRRTEQKLADITTIFTTSAELRRQVHDDGQAAKSALIANLAQDAKTKQELEHVLAKKAHVECKIKLRKLQQRQQENRGGKAMQAMVFLKNSKEKAECDTLEHQSALAELIEHGSKNLAALRHEIVDITEEIDQLNGEYMTHGEVAKAEASIFMRGLCGQALHSTYHHGTLGTYHGTLGNTRDYLADGDSDACSIGIAEDDLGLDRGEFATGAVVAEFVAKPNSDEMVKVSANDVPIFLLSDKELAEARARLLHVASPAVRQAAAKELARSAPARDVQTTEAFLSCLEYEECAGVRCAVLDALGRIGEVHGTVGFAAATGAVASIGAAGGVGAEALAAVRRLARRGACAAVCKAMTARILNPEERYATKTRVALLELLSSVVSASGDVNLAKDALQTAVHVAKSKGPSHELMACIRIIHHTAPKNDQTVISLLVDNLEDPDEDLRKAAADALREIGGSRRLLQELTRCLDTKSIKRRDAALHTLRRLQVEAEDPVVRQVISQAVFRGNQAARAGGEVILAIRSRLHGEACESPSQKKDRSWVADQHLTSVVTA